ncbi:MAG: 4-(cytidine 5'-diphospho)-2-C-methyl-D-erythritol kinase [Candidatus Omnitrophota bacterium]|nr:MAG: 4-(cytidine 5'-diphospho)-2-C-methyl-D-erythritol kinase [Candidatus Omnitrophota bacterium]
MVRAPAKINLFLEITGKRADGYHNLETLFLKIAFYDQLYFYKRKEGIEIDCHARCVPNDRFNIVYQAADLLRREFKLKQGVKIRIVKRIPVGAGLGGGSSDAAAALKGLNNLWNLELSRKTLFNLARRLGADVPLFFSEASLALGRGIGDELSSIDLGRKFWIVLFFPDVFVSTKQVYESVPVCLTNKKNNVKLLIYALKMYNLELIEKYSFNRLEDVTFRLHNCLLKIKQKISARSPRAVLMSGSGAAFFLIAKDRKEAMQIRNRLQDNYQVMVVRSL